jgi:hypothetical protein
MARSVTFAAVAAAASSLVQAANFFPATDPGFLYSGRSQINADGTRSFDWEGFQVHANLVSASYLDVIMNTTGATTKIRTQLQIQGTEVSGGTMWLDASEHWVSPTSNSNAYRGIQTLTFNTTVRVFHELEPAFTGAGANSYFTFVGFSTDGQLGPLNIKTRNIEVRDSTTCSPAAHNPLY